MAQIQGPAEGKFTNANGLEMFCKYWYPENQDIRALVHVIHGLGEHVGRYDTIAASFTKMGCAVFGHDHVGHGRSGGTRVDIDDFNKFVRDCLQHVDIMTEKHPDLPVIIFGHSMGGTIAILTMNAAPERFIGAIFGSPAVRIDPAQATTFMVFMGKMLSYVLPQASVGKLNLANLSRDPAVVEDYKKDPLVWHGGIKARFAVQMLNACQKIQDEFEKATYPFLIQHGTMDELCDIVGSEMFFKNASSDNKVYKRYEGYYHELDKEPEGQREVVFKDIEEWTEKLLTSVETKRGTSPSSIDMDT